MDHLYSPRYKHNGAYDTKQYNVHLDRKYHHMGFGIYHKCMPMWLGNLRRIDIQGDNSVRVQYNLVNKSKLLDYYALYKLNLDHMDSVRMDWLVHHELDKLNKHNSS